MPDDVTQWAQAARALAEAVKAMLGMAKAAKDALPDSLEKQAFEQAVEEVESSADVMLLELAKEWRYPLCRCTFPPTVMLEQAAARAGGTYAIFKCPECGNFRQVPINILDSDQ